jgi:hypothetical protein
MADMPKMQEHFSAMPTKFLPPESSTAFELQRVFPGYKKNFSYCIVEFTTIFKGRGTGPVYETSLAWMPTRATGMCSCGLINGTCAVASGMK